MVRHLRLVIAVTVLVILNAGPARAAEVSVGPTPYWVVVSEPDLAPSAREDSRGGGHLLLLDSQHDARQGAVYYRQVVRVTSADGVAAFSDVMATFDPAYQELVFHHVRVIRGDDVLDRLAPDDIRTYQREKGLEYGLFDGEATAVINLVDVRIGDVIDHAYTTRGRHPLLGDHVVSGFFQEALRPAREIRTRLLAARGPRLHQFKRNDAESYAVSEEAGFQEYAWSGHEVDATAVDPVVPPGWQHRRVVTLTSFRDWADVVAWALPLYRLDADDRAELATRTEGLLAGESVEERVLAAIRFVQDEVRYLARSEGIWGWQPRKPAQCLARRHGDCKDKSLLLVALLEQLGVEAHPVLVSQESRARLANRPPVPMSFDHCVVGFTWEGLRYFVDPTRNHQGGGLGGTSFPDFGLGLPVHEAAHDLVELPGPNTARIAIHEAYVVDAIDSGGASFEVETRYHGDEADSQRATLAGASLDEVGRHYLQFYSNVYPGIEQAAPLEVVDADREGDNVFVVRERYRIRDAWQPDCTEDGRPCFELYPLELNTHLDMVASPARTAPYWAGPAVVMEVTSEVTMPEDWPVVIEPVEIVGDGFSFSHRAGNDGPTVHASYHYRRWLEEVPAEAAPAFIAAHDDMIDQLGLYLFEVEPVAMPSRSAILLALAALAFGAPIAWLVARRYDPTPRADVGEPRRIGGWLVVPAIGVAVAPVATILFAFVAIDRASVEPDPGSLSLLAASEVVCSVLSLVLSVLTAWLFFRRRSSAPAVLVVFLVAPLVIAVVNTMIASASPGAETMFGGGYEITRSAIHMAIWVPYALHSKRVRETFVRRQIGTP